MVRRQRKGVFGSFSLTVHTMATELTAVLYHIERTQGLIRQSTALSRLALAPLSRLTFVGVAILSFPGFCPLTNQAHLSKSGTKLRPLQLFYCLTLSSDSFAHCVSLVSLPP